MKQSRINSLFRLLFSRQVNKDDFCVYPLNHVQIYFEIVRERRRVNNERIGTEVAFRAYEKFS